MMNIDFKERVMEFGRMVIQQTAIREGVSETEVRAEMEAAIQDSYDPQNPQWASSPFSDRLPTPEEFIVWAATNI